MNNNKNKNTKKELFKDKTITHALFLAVQFRQKNRLFSVAYYPTLP